jgi:hypothetical protein
MTKLPLGSLPVLALLFAQQARPTPPSVFLDPFDGTQLDPSWSVLNPGLGSVQVAGGELRITPTQSGLGSIWFEDAEGVLVRRSVAGNFTATTRVHARSLANPAQPPAVPYKLGGLLARDPGSSSGARDSVHVALGSGVLTEPPFAPVCAEEKTTLASSSAFTLHPISSPDGELRLQRRGTSFELSYRPIGGPWVVLATHVRADLPATLDVGLMAYSASSPADLVVSFERFLLAP